MKVRFPDRQYETWVDIIDTRYQISSFGRVMSFANDWPRIVDGWINKFGYPTVEIHGKSMLVHRLVAAYFIPNPNGLPQVNHKDANKLNNHYFNLEWCTSQYNIQYAYDKGFKSNVGSKHPGTKLTEENVLEMRRFYDENKPITVAKMAEKFGLNHSQMDKILRGINWKHVPMR